MKFFAALKPLFKGWLVSFTGWSLVALVMIAHSMSVGRTSWERNIHASIRDWLPWAILTPLLFRLASRFPIDRRTWRAHAAVHISCAILVVAGVHWWKEFTGPSLGYHGPSPFAERMRIPPGAVFLPNERPPPPPHPHFDLLAALSFDLPIYIMIVSAAHTLHLYRRLEIRKGQLATAHLQALQSRLQPHFLFNTLNTISGLVHKAPDKADAVLTMLSDLLRFSLDNTSEAQIPLAREIEFVQKYLDIMKVRYDDRVQYEFLIAPETLTARVPTLLLQPFVENAFKYGIEGNLTGGKITIRSSRAANNLQLSVSNTGSTFPPNETFSEGLGIANTRERLRELFGDKSTLTFQNGDGVTVEITIPFHTTV